MTADIGAKVLRVFLAWPGVTLLREGGGRYDIAKAVWQKAHESFSPEETWAWCREGLVESARHAGEHGVTLALQNHPPVIGDYKDVLRMVREVASPHLKVCFDARLEHGKDEEAIRKATVEVGPLQVLSHYGGEYEQGPRRDQGDRRGALPGGGPAGCSRPGTGATSATSCATRSPWSTGKTVGVEYVHENARLAAEYMRGVIAEARKQRAARA